MKRILSAIVYAGIAVVVMANGARANEYDVNCSTMIAGTGHVAHVDGSHDWRFYKGHIPPGLAKRRAIDNWEATVAQNCNRYSAHWWRSKVKNVECDRGAGQEYCTATAIPGKKFFGFLLSE